MAYLVGYWQLDAGKAGMAKGRRLKEAISREVRSWCFRYHPPSQCLCSRLFPWFSFAPFWPGHSSVWRSADFSCVICQVWLHQNGTALLWPSNRPEIRLTWGGILIPIPDPSPQPYGITKGLTDLEQLHWKWRWWASMPTGGTAASLRFSVNQLLVSVSCLSKTQMWYMHTSKWVKS